VISAAVERLNAAKVRARNLRVNISHSPLVAAAAEKFRGSLANVQFRAPQIPVLNATTGAIHRWGSFRDVLVDQLVQPPLWSESVKGLCKMGITTFAECGAVKHLAEWTKETCPDATVYSITDQTSMEETIDLLAA
jgi:[acyl-carrier-protein] S-malonyltransferase